MIAIPEVAAKLSKKRCPHCGGWIHYELDPDFGWEWTCVNCALKGALDDKVRISFSLPSRQTI